MPALAAALVLAGIASCGDGQDGSRVIVTVNGKPITYGELLDELQRKHGPIALLDLVDEAVIRAEAQRREIGVSPQELEVGLGRAAARVGSLADLRLKLERAGIPMESYERKIETDLMLDKIIAQQVEVGADEISAYYEANKDEFRRGPRVRARMIMLFGDRSNAEAVREALGDPEADFAGLAKSLSEDEATRDAGGDMGYFEKGDYAPEIAEVAFSLKPGEISDIIKAPDGWVILKVEDTAPAGPLSLEEVGEQIRHRLAREKQGELRGTWLLEARKQARLRVTNRDLREAVRARMETPRLPPLPGEL